MNTSAIDIFCGIGGLSYGLKKAGISVAAGLDIDKSCKYPYEKNVQAEFISRDVSNLRGKEIIGRYWSTDVSKILAGCAPCQPFSTHSNKIKDKTQTRRWRLIHEFKRLVRETNPHIVTMENVPNLANQEIFEDFVAFLELSEYYVTYSNVYCPDYGIPQKRRRLVLLASKYGKISLLHKTHSKGEYVTLRQAIKHLPPVEAGEECKSDLLHRTSKLSPINLQRIKASKPNGTWLDWSEDLQLECHKKETGRTYNAVYGRMAWDEPSPTITTQFYNYGTGRFGHPTQNRALTMREAAILQTFPEDFVFYESKKDILLKRLSAYIGNAVPVKLAVVIGESILNHLEVHNDRS
ncbi:MAG: DNA (cytosine-5-)-methyltransferase [Anaerolineae bacterium UTCFX2]|jgi:DNA (cytosine-5)-methyltransferase 1|nr:DNA cytosine methyltransferase [Anaerolineae bacterium]MCZ7552034.1 DNA cytosine methyltransferase [Anaerolineales bacterium]OQY90957.1 MAG: DNA (cytosine-5-)-methyltransferase [Anaerolineae bacterium UTCFX2]